MKTGAAKEHLLSSEKKIVKKAEKKPVDKGNIDHPITEEGTVKKVKAAATKKMVKK